MMMMMMMRQIKCKRKVSNDFVSTNDVKLNGHRDDDSRGLSLKRGFVFILSRF
jgi:hypothetical protein